MCRKINLWLAPLHGITYYNFRNCFIKHFGGIDAAITPFFAAQSKDKLNPKKLKDIFPENNRALKIVPQIMGNNANDIRDTILVLNETFGYQSFNWNIGCPMNQIVRKKRGCGVMPFPELVEEVVNEVCGKTPAKFSLKMRLGMKTLGEGREIINRMNHYPLDFVCIHPRLGTQHYEGTVDLFAFAELLELTNHKIIYSGDINSVSFIYELKKQFPQIQDFMLGRGLLQNPFLAEEITGLVNSDETNKQRFVNFYHDYFDSLTKDKGEKIALSMQKELWHYFAKFWELEENEIINLLRIKDLATFNKSVEIIYSD